MTRYSRGADFERAVKADLGGDGYYVVRAAGSKGAVDLVAVKPGETLFVQCKLGSIGHAEWNNLHRIGLDGLAIPIVADRPSRGVIRYRRITGEHQMGSREWPAAPWSADRAAA